jgi:hypothetical protein
MSRFLLFLLEEEKKRFVVLSIRFSFEKNAGAISLIINIFWVG